MKMSGFETPNLYENPEVSVRTGSTPGTQKPRKRNFFVKFVSLCVLLLLVVLCIIAVFILMKINSTTEQTSTSVAGASATTAEGQYESCAELLKNGFVETGIYKVRSAQDGSYHDVYCDMTTAGGGWSLVASIHRNEDGLKCNVSDRWSYSPMTYTALINGKGSKSWSDESTMGDVLNATSNDYKGFLYFTGNASDVMLSHVPNNAHVNEYQDKAFLTYHTSNGFLNNYGSSLRNLYRDHAPLETLDIIGMDEKTAPLVQKNFKPPNNWFNYTFNSLTSSAYISNRGRQVIDLENKVYFRINDEPYRQIKYGDSYTDSKTYHVTSSSGGQPFLTMATVSNFDDYPSKFVFKVVTRPEADARYSTSTITLSYKRCHAYARYHHISNRGEGKPAVALVFFRIQSYDNNAAPNTVYVPTHPNRGREKTYEMGVTEVVKNIVLGYTLFTRFEPDRSGWYYVHREEIQTFLMTVIDALASPEVQSTALTFPSDIYTPVKVTKGKISSPNQGVKKNFVQFRAYDSNGSPFALCPGVRLRKGTDPAKFCIGSANTWYNNPERCGDFPAWETLKEHVFINRTITGDGKFVNDLHSTIFIYTR